MLKIYKDTVDKLSLVYWILCVSLIQFVCYIWIENGDFCNFVLLSVTITNDEPVNHLSESLVVKYVLIPPPELLVLLAESTMSSVFDWNKGKSWTLTLLFKLRMRAPQLPCSSHYDLVRHNTFNVIGSIFVAICYGSILSISFRVTSLAMGQL